MNISEYYYQRSGIVAEKQNILKKVITSNHGHVRVIKMILIKMMNIIMTIMTVHQGHVISLSILQTRNAAITARPNLER